MHASDLNVKVMSEVHIVWLHSFRQSETSYIAKFVAR